MMMSMVVTPYILQQALAGILDAGDCPILTQSRADLERQMDKTMLAGLSSELNDFIMGFDACFRSTPSRGHLAAYVRGQVGPDHYPQARAQSGVAWLGGSTTWSAWAESATITLGEARRGL